MRRKEPRGASYLDIFSDSALPREPRIMKDGTSIRWPLGWTPDEAAAWRQEHNLDSPEAKRKRFQVVRKQDELPPVIDMTKWRDN
jgi:hypothetical protein